MKKILLFTIIIMLILATFLNVWADETDKYINVRIRSPRLENEFIKISGRENIQLYIGNPLDSEFIFDSQEKDLIVKIDSYYSNGSYYNEYDDKSTEGPYHIIIEESYNDYEKALENLKKIEEETKIDGFVYYRGNNFYTVFGRYTSENRTKDIAASKFNDYNYNIENHKSNSILVFDTSGEIIFSYENNYEIFFSSGERGSIFFDGVEYHGDAAFYIIEEYKLLSINIVTIEEYLKGVVPSEIPPSWNEEALKAQAVAARTYAVANTYNKSNYGYHVVDNQNSQVYGGIHREYTSTNKAVEDTKNQLIYYNNSLITAFYHSTSGGKTADSGNVWSITLPYLRSKEDAFSNISPHTEWNIDYTKDELIKILTEDFGVEDIYDMEIIEISDDERVIETSIKTDKGEVNLIKEEIRAVLGYSKLKSTWFTINKNNQITIQGYTDNLKSNLAEKNKLSFDGNKVLDTTISYNKKESILSKEEKFQINTSPDNFTLVGRGWGHGIGMSQYGAKQMAEEGFTYDEILEYYYTGVTVK